MANAAKSSARKLKDVHRAFLVRELACFSSPQEAADALKETHGAEISPQGAQHYDPTKAIGQNLAPKWVDLFWEIREEFKRDLGDTVPLAHKNVRIRELARTAEKLKRSGNLQGYADMIVTISKETGEVFTNRRELTGKDRGPVQFEDVGQMSDEELDAELKRLGFDPANLHAAPEQSH